MGHFRIILQTGDRAEVRFGKVVRKQIFPDIIRRFLLGKPKAREERIGYIVNLDEAEGGKGEYRLARSLDGQWTTVQESGFPEYHDDKFCILIRKAIEEHEIHSSAEK